MYGQLDDRSVKHTPLSRQDNTYKADGLTRSVSCSALVESAPSASSIGRRMLIGPLRLTVLNFLSCAGKSDAPLHAEVHLLSVVSPGSDMAIQTRRTF